MTTITRIGCGHGHVYPRPDGVKARCGGRLICKACAIDWAQKCRDEWVIPSATVKPPTPPPIPSE